MKRFYVMSIAAFLSFSADRAISASEYSLEHKVAIVSVGKLIPDSDTSVLRAKRILESLAAHYGITPIVAADMIAAGKKELGKIDANTLDIAEGALVFAGDQKMSKRELAEYIAAYVVTRQSGVSHYGAVRGYIGLKILMAGKGR